MSAKASNHQRIELVFTKAAVTPDDVALIQHVIRTHCVRGGFCKNPNGDGIICQMKLMTKRRESWLANKAMIMYAVVAVGDEAKRLLGIMSAQPATWAWPNAAPPPLPVEPNDSPMQVTEDNSINTTTNTTDNSTVTTTNSSATDNTDNSTNNTANNSNTANNTMSNGDNSTFNLNFYLSEKCKNATDINVFMQGVTEAFTNIDYVNNRPLWNYAEGLALMPYAKGVAKLITDHLADMPQVDRPLQCTDLKREIFQVLSNGNWHICSPHDAVKTPLRDTMFAASQTRVGYAIQWKIIHGLDSSKDADRTNILKNMSPPTSTDMGLQTRKNVLAIVGKQSLVDKSA